MKFVDEYRDAAAARTVLSAIEKRVTRPWTLMEICGGQTHAIVQYGLDQLLPKSISLLHGPGCPVCVTPIEVIDQALEIAADPKAILCSFGDMLRVPGSSKDLLTVKAAGGDVRITYSPLEAVAIARENPSREVVFFAVGFETTAPMTAMAAALAKRDGIQNFSLLVSHVRVPPAIEAILSSPQNKVQGFLAAGHVCAIMGSHEYRPLAKKYGVPMVITGFEPLDILQGVDLCVKQLEAGKADVEIQYRRAVRPEGNLQAQKQMSEVFEVIPRKWRGIGEIPESGLGLNAAYAALDATKRFKLKTGSVPEPKECLSGQVLQGAIKPMDCPAFGTKCTPEHPLGATMVSSEGACAAYYRYRKK